MWVPKWLGEVYSKLYYSFRLELFTFKDALNALGIPSDKLMVIFSKLHKNYLLTIFKRGRPRHYRLLNPENFILLASGYVNPINIPQERYVNIIYDVFRAAKERYRLRSLAVYGSVARGTAKEYSDIDFLMISDEFNGSIASRMDRLIGIEHDVKDEIRWLIRNGVYTSLNIYPMKPEEAKQLPILFLDLIDEAKILYDDGLLENLINEMKARTVRLGARKIYIDDGSWYWDLKPDYRPYEMIEL